MKKQVVLAASFVLFLVSLPLVSIGTVEDTAILWWLGMALLVLAGLIPPFTRYAVSDDADEEEEEDT